LNNNATLLIESYSLLEKALSGNGKLPVNKKIQWKVEYLNEMHGLDREDIHGYLFEEFVTKELYRKYGKNKTKLSTFIMHCTNWGLSTLIRKYDAIDNNYCETPLEDGSGYRVSRKNANVSLSMLEELGIECAIENNTPEDHYFAKELFDLMRDFYSENEILVLLGFKDRRSEAERLSIDYHAYCKRLERKNSAFKLILQEAGYC